MKAALAVLINLFFINAALAQQPVIQSGSPPAGQIGVWQSKGVLGGAGTANAPNPNKPITDLPVVGTGEPLCVYDAPTTSTVGYHKLCLGANQGGKGVIDYSANGGAPIQEFDIKVNGVAAGVGTAPGGATNSLQKNSGGGVFGAYTGTTCPSGQFASAVDSNGTATCATPTGSPSGSVSNLQTKASASSFGTYAGSACPGGQVPNGLDANGAVTGCVAAGAAPSGAEGQTQIDRGGALGHQTSVYFGPGSVFAGHTITGNGVADDTAGIQAAIDYALANGIEQVTCGDGTYLISKDSNKVGLYLDPPSGLRTNFSAPATYTYSITFEGTGVGVYGTATGCRLYVNFNDGVGLLLGAGQRQKVANLAVVGRAGGYRANIPNTSIGIGIAGTGGGASSTLIENTDVWNFYACYSTTANGNGTLGDSNTFRHTDSHNCYKSWTFPGTQNDINLIYDGRCQATICVDSEVSRTVAVFGGNLSGGNGLVNHFTVSSVSSFTKTADQAGNDYTFTAVLASPDEYVEKVYDSWTAVTTHYGVVPFTLTNWNAGTSTATFQLRPAWVFANYGVADLTTVTDMQAEIAAVTKVYGTERLRVALGMGISLKGIHVENPGACTTLFDASNGYGGASINKIESIYIGYDPSLTTYGIANDDLKGRFYCQNTFPFITMTGGGAKLTIDGGDFGQNDGSGPLLIEEGKTAQRALSVRNAVSLRNVVLSRWEPAATSFGQYDFSGSGRTGDNQGWGFGDWDRSYFLPYGWTDSGNTDRAPVSGPLVTPYFGYFPAGNPTLTPDIYALVSGALGTLGHYPPIACTTTYKLLGWNSGAGDSYARSASCPGYSWGKNLTTATVGSTVTCSAKGKSHLIYLDAATLTFMFGGLGFTWDAGDGSGALQYEVTGVYPQLGYISVMRAATETGDIIAGTKTTTYTPSPCTIGQAPFAWRKDLSATNGTIGQLLRSDGAGQFGTPLNIGTGLSISGSDLTAPGGASGALSLVSTKTANNTGSTLEWTGIPTTSVDTYVLTCSGIQPTTAGSVIYLQFGEGGGPTWKTSGYSYALTRLLVGGATTDLTGTAQGGIRLSALGLDTGGIPFSTTAYLNALGSAVTHTASFQSALQYFGTNSFMHVQGSGTYDTDTTAISAVRIATHDSNNLNSGKCSLYTMTD